ncbi:MAG: phage/plasmid primase, P4 family [Clostridiales bacterium]|nr:phage/plasmid primase, P4 family [Clostridiales bacterium]
MTPDEIRKILNNFTGNEIDQEVRSGMELEENVFIPISLPPSGEIIDLICPLANEEKANEFFWMISSGEAIDSTFCSNDTPQNNDFVPIATDGGNYEFPPSIDFEHDFDVDEETKEYLKKNHHQTHVVPDITQGLGKRQSNRDIVELERFVVKEHTLMVYHGQLYEFRPPCWRLLNARECTVMMRKFLRKHDLDKTLTSKEFAEIYRQLLSEPDIQREKDFTRPEHQLNLRDGTLDLCSMILRQHNPEDGYFHYLDLYSEDIFDPGEGAEFESFVYQISNGNPLIRQQLLELTALAMTNYEAKCFYVLLGPSNCGKTQWGRFLEELLGRDNVESIAGVHDFSNRFTTSALEGKLLGTCLDLPDTPLPSIAIGTIKQFVGDDPIKVEAKYKNSHTIYRKPMLLFAGNHPIQLPALSNEQALLNRMVVVPFANPVSEQDTIPQLYKLLLEESPYIVAEAIRAYQVLMQNNFIVTRTEIPPEYAPQDSRENYQTVKQFVSDCCSFNEEHEIETATLYNAYQRYAEETGIKYASRTDFSRLLSELLKDMPTVKKIKRVRDSNARGYRGIQLDEE